MGTDYFGLLRLLKEIPFCPGFAEVDPNAETASGLGL
jgi:hypothetical protein